MGRVRIRIEMSAPAYRNVRDMLVQMFLAEILLLARRHSIQYILVREQNCHLSASNTTAPSETIAMLQTL